MAPQRSNDPSSDEEDGAPESLSLNQSKKAIQQQEKVLKNFQAAEKDKKRAVNREKDRRLKEQSANRKNKEVIEAMEESIERMRKAMKEVGGKTDEDEDEEMDEGEESEGEASESNEDDDPISSHEAESETTKKNRDYLPDHIFAAAFASQSSKQVQAGHGAASSNLKKKSSHRKRSGIKTAKDIVVGSRVVRSLSSEVKPELRAAARTVPSRKVDAFLNRTLGLGGRSQKKKGWERRPVNLGVLKRAGPAAGFVRNP